MNLIYLVSGKQTNRKGLYNRNIHIKIILIRKHIYVYMFAIMLYLFLFYIKFIPWKCYFDYEPTRKSSETYLSFNSKQKN